MCAEEIKSVLQRILAEEIYNNRYWCIHFARMGSKKCQEKANIEGWHTGEWLEEEILKERTEGHASKAELQRERCRKYRAAHREELNAKCRAYRARLRAEREAEKEETAKQDLQKRKACLAKIEAEREERKRLRKERLKAYQKKWVTANREKARESCRKYYERHKEEVKAKNLQRYYAQKEVEAL